MEFLNNNPDCSEVVGVHRHSDYPLDYQLPASIESCANSLYTQGSFQLIINTIGVLHTSDWMPEKKLDDVNAEQLMELLKINTIGPALTIRHFSKLLAPQNSIMVTLSAKVGSIEDNRLGGWYSYRASKAALNMMIKTAAIELKRTKPNLTLIAMHPGTVNSNLSKPFGGESKGQNPVQAAKMMLSVIRELTPEKTGSFLSYKNEEIPW